MPVSILLKNQTAGALFEQLSHLGVTEKLARKLQSAAVKRGAAELPRELPEVSPRVLAAVADAARIPHLERIDKVISPTDGFAKYLFRGEGPEAFETVRIPLLHRADDPKYVICVSSQVGCAMRCAFCATGKMGFRRNLATWEIVDQVVKVQADSEYPIRGIVFMGMGEPMLNYENVIRAARIFSEPCGMAIDAKAISISTVGLVPQIRRFTEERQPYRLVISLTSADTVRRKALLPIEEHFPLSELIDAARAYHETTGIRVRFAWTLISGLNTSRDEARKLAELTAGLPITLDLIDVNDATGVFKPPSDDERNAFRNYLREELGMPVARRYSGGQDINAGCGMLAASKIADAKLHIADSD